MALLFMDSFDHYTTADLLDKWSATTLLSGGTIGINSGTGRRGSNSLRIGSGGTTSAACAVRRVLAGGDATAILGFAFLLPAGSMGTAGVTIAAVHDGGTTQVTLRLNADYTLSVLRGPNAASPTILGTSTAAVSAASFVYIEWKTLIHPSVGTVDVRVNGAPVLALTAQNTRISAVSQWTGCTLGTPENLSSSWLPTVHTADFDDLYVLDGTGAAPWNTFLGDVRVDARLPTGAGATTGWTPLAGANWDAVNDTAPDDDTTYTSTSTVGVTDTFVTQDAPVVGATIYGVQHCLNLKKMDAGACTVAPVIRHSGVDYPGAAISPGTTYAYGLAIAAVNPGTGATWVEADFNAAEFGYKRVS
jgi:hypothetical protein